VHSEHSRRIAEPFRVGITVFVHSIRSSCSSFLLLSGYFSSFPLDSQPPLVAVRLHLMSLRLVIGYSRDYDTGRLLCHWYSRVGETLLRTPTILLQRLLIRLRLQYFPAAFKDCNSPILLQTWSFLVLFSALFSWLKGLYSGVGLCIVPDQWYLIWVL